MLKQPIYRADIDGLRAVAVLAILVFHLDPAVLPGGFVGVDIFFVISGYLITGQILALGDRFSFRDFYLRRFLRLYPALVLVVVATLVAGYVRLSPDDYRSLGASALATVFGVSNIWFLTDIDYFNPENAFRPLLHTWSLGVEEQFYLVWPLILTLVLRGRVRFGPLIVMVLFASLALAVAAPRFFGPSAAFYLTPFRVHAFALGAVLHAFAAPRLWGGLISRLVQVACLGLLVVVFLVPDAGRWSVLHALGLAPCVATAAVIALGANAPLPGLVAVPMRLVGRWSYSIYLVHWPLIVFARDVKVVPLGVLDLMGLFAACVVIGAVLHVAVEQRLRLRGASDRLPAALLRLRLALLGVAASATAVGAVAVVANDGLPRRIANKKVAGASGELSFAGDLCRTSRRICIFGSRASSKIVYLIGDSHALNMIYGLDGLFREMGIRGIAFNYHGCLYLKGTRRFHRGVPDKTCNKSVAAAYAAVEADQAPVIIAGSWNGYATEIGPNDGPAFEGTGKYYEEWIEKRLADSLRLLASGGRRVVLMGVSYDTGTPVPNCLLRPGDPDEESCGFTTRKAAKERDSAFDAMIARMAAVAPSVIVLDPKEVFCRHEQCKVREGDTLYMRDSVHLTNAGSKFLIEGLRQHLKIALD